MKRTLLIAATFATLATPVMAQMPSMSPEKTPLELQYEREQREKEQIEKDYNATMKRLKAQNGSQTKADPWRGVRPSTDASAKR